MYQPGIAQRKRLRKITMEGRMFSYKRIMNGGRRSPGRLFLTALLALLWLAIPGVSPARAQGPALWMASPRQGPGTAGGVIEIRPFGLTVSGAPHQVKLVS